MHVQRRERRNLRGIGLLQRRKLQGGEARDGQKGSCFRYEIGMKRTLGSVSLKFLSRI